MNRFVFLACIFLMTIAMLNVAYPSNASASSRKGSYLEDIRNWYPDANIINDNTDLGVNTAVVFTSSLNDLSEKGIELSNIFNRYENFIIICDSKFESNFSELNIKCDQNSINGKEDDKVTINEKLNARIIFHHQFDTNLIIIPEVYFVSSYIYSDMDDYFDTITNSSISVAEQGTLEDLFVNIIFNKKLVTTSILLLAVISTLLLIYFRKRINLKVNYKGILYGFYYKNIQLNLYLLYIFIMFTIVMIAVISSIPYDNLDVSKILLEISKLNLVPPKDRLSFVLVIAIATYLSIFITLMSFFLIRVLIYIYETGVISIENKYIDLYSRRLVYLVFALVGIAFASLSYPNLTYFCIAITGFIFSIQYLIRKRQYQNLFFKYDNVLIPFVLIIFCFLSVYQKGSPQISFRKIIDVEEAINLKLPYVITRKPNEYLLSGTSTDSSNVYLNEFMVSSSKWNKISNQHISNWDKDHNFIIISSGPSKAAEYLSKGVDIPLLEKFPPQSSRYWQNNLYIFPRSSVSSELTKLRFTYKCLSDSAPNRVTYKLYSSVFSGEEQNYPQQTVVRFPGCDYLDVGSFELPLNLNLNSNEYVVLRFENSWENTHTNIDVQLTFLDENLFEKNYLGVLIPPRNQILIDSSKSSNETEIFVYNFISKIPVIYPGRKSLNLGDEINKLINMKLLNDEITIWSDSVSEIKIE